MAEASYRRFWPDVTAPVEFDEGIYDDLYEDINKRFFRVNRNGYDADYERSRATDILSQERQMFVASLGTRHCAETLELFERLARADSYIPRKNRESARYEVGRIIMTNFEPFAAVAEGDDPELSQTATGLIFEAVDSFGLFGYDGRESRQMSFLIDKLRAQASGPQPMNLDTVTRVVSETLLRRATDEQQGQIFDIAQGLLKDESTRATGVRFLEAIVQYCADADDNNSWATGMIGTQFRNQTLYEALSDTYGLDFKRLIQAWAHGHEKGDPSDYVRQNLETILALEAKTPGMCRELNRRFNIRNFARCSDEAWEDQYQNRDRKDLPYGVMVYPESDYNSAFYKMNTKVGKFRERLKELGCLLRIYEASDVDEATQAITDAEDVYGRQLEFAVMCAHGTTQSMQFGKRGNTDGSSCTTLTAALVQRELNDPQSPRLSKLARQFAPLARLYLISCSTGKESIVTPRCIGNVLSTALGIIVHAPNEDVSVRGITAYGRYAGANSGIDIGLTFKGGYGVKFAGLGVEIRRARLEAERLAAEAATAPEA